MEHIDITIDLETCSLKSTAAIMQIAAVAWDRTVVPGDVPNNDILPFLFAPEKVPYNFNSGVDLRDCFMLGMDIDADTQAFWGKQNDEVKNSVCSLGISSLANVLIRFNTWIEKLKSTYDAKSVCIWSQGSDFDIPILKNAYGLCGLKFPVSYRNVRCARTYILEKGGENYDAEHSYFGAQNSQDIYKMFPPLPEGLQNDNLVHDALYDCLRTTWAVWNIMHNVTNQE